MSNLLMMGNFGIHLAIQCSLRLQFKQLNSARLYFAAGWGFLPVSHEPGLLTLDDGLFQFR